MGGDEWLLLVVVVCFCVLVKVGEVGDCGYEEVVMSGWVVMSGCYLFWWCVCVCWSKIAISQLLAQNGFL